MQEADVDIKYTEGKENIEADYVKLIETIKQRKKQEIPEEEYKTILANDFLSKMKKLHLRHQKLYDKYVSTKKRKETTKNVSKTIANPFVVFWRFLKAILHLIGAFFKWMAKMNDEKLAPAYKKKLWRAWDHNAVYGRHAREALYRPFRLMWLAFKRWFNPKFAFVKKRVIDSFSSMIKFFVKIGKASLAFIKKIFGYVKKFFTKLAAIIKKIIGVFKSIYGKTLGPLITKVMSLVKGGGGEDKDSI